MYEVGDLVILTKKRQGLIRYVGNVEFDGGEDTWYGVELLGGSSGHMDGTINGKRYFMTGKSGGVLILASKIVRKMKKIDLLYIDGTNPNSKLNVSNSQFHKEIGGLDSDSDQLQSNVFRLQFTQSSSLNHNDYDGGTLNYDTDPALSTNTASKLKAKSIPNIRKQFKKPHIVSTPPVTSLNAKARSIDIMAARSVNTPPIQSMNAPAIQQHPINISLSPHHSYGSLNNYNTFSLDATDNNPNYNNNNNNNNNNNSFNNSIMGVLSRNSLSHSFSNNSHSHSNSNNNNNNDNNNGVNARRGSKLKQLWKRKNSLQIRKTNSNNVTSNNNGSNKNSNNGNNTGSNNSNTNNGSTLKIIKTKSNSKKKNKKKKNKKVGWKPIDYKLPENDTSFLAPRSTFVPTTIRNASKKRTKKTNNNSKTSNKGKNCNNKNSKNGTNKMKNRRFKKNSKQPKHNRNMNQLPSKRHPKKPSIIRSQTPPETPASQKRFDFNSPNSSRNESSHSGNSGNHNSGYNYNQRSPGSGESPYDNGPGYSSFTRARKRSSLPDYATINLVNHNINNYNNQSEIHVRNASRSRYYGIKIEQSRTQHVNMNGDLWKSKFGDVSYVAGSSIENDTTDDDGGDGDEEEDMSESDFDRFHSSYRSHKTSASYTSDGDISDSSIDSNFSLSRIRRKRTRKQEYWNKQISLCGKNGSNSLMYAMNEMPSLNEDRTSDTNNGNGGNNDETSTNKNSGSGKNDANSKEENGKSEISNDNNENNVITDNGEAETDMGNDDDGSGNGNGNVGENGESGENMDNETNVTDNGSKNVTYTHKGRSNSSNNNTINDVVSIDLSKQRPKSATCRGSKNNAPNKVDWI